MANKRKRNAKQIGAHYDQPDLFSVWTKPTVETVKLETLEETPRAEKVESPRAEKKVQCAVGGSRGDTSLASAIEYVLGSRGPGRPAKQLNLHSGPFVHRLLDVREAAARLGLSKSTLDKMRCSGRGPKFIRATDRAIRYDPADLDAFANERRRRSTSDQAIDALRS